MMVNDKCLRVIRRGVRIVHTVSVQRSLRKPFKKIHVAIYSNFTFYKNLPQPDIHSGICQIIFRL